MQDALKLMVLAGGPDRERAVSLNSGAAVAQALTTAGHEVITCDLTPDDTTALNRFQAEAHHAIFPTLHGPWGEGGGMQALLDQRGIPYVGSQTQAAALAMNKDQAKQVFIKQGLTTPASVVLGKDQRREAIQTPCVVKPIDEGSSVHLSICHTPKEAEHALNQAFKEHDAMLVETYIAGRELTCGVLNTGPGAYALPPIEIRPADGAYDYDAKYLRDDTDYLFNTLDPSIQTQVQEQAIEAHRALGCRDLSRTDFILSETGVLYVLETNTLPGFTDHSLLPKSAEEAGLPMPQLCDTMVRWAIARHDA